MIKKQLDKMLFIDIETAGGYKDLETLKKENPTLATIFSRYQYWFKDRFSDIENSDEETVYLKKSALIPEFGRIVCVSFGLMKDSEFKVSSYYGYNEKDILVKLQKLLKRAEELDMFLVGHNIEKFDAHYISTRMVINGIEPPKILPDENSKPWETKLLDTKKIWQRSQYNSLSSLDLLCTVLDVDSPKVGEVVGDMVHENFWKYTDYSMQEIVEYCERDVVAVRDIVVKLQNLK
jgi:DNA polymerase elongation subunit (family B)